MRYVRIAVGLAIWAAVVAGVWYATRDRVADGRLDAPAVKKLLEFATAETMTAKIEAPHRLDVEVGDPVFVVDERNQIRQVGEVKLLRDPDTGHALRRGWVEKADVVFYGPLPGLSEAKLVYHREGRSLEWVLATMLPQSKRDEITAKIKLAYERHHEEILKALLPLVHKSLRDAARVVERDLPEALARHRRGFEALGRKYQKNIVDKDIVPLVQKEIWPIVKKRVTPLAEEIGYELWGKLPKWGLAWRKGVDYVPFTRGNRFIKRWQSYVSNEAMPLFKEHGKDFVAVVKDVMTDAAANQEVRRVLRGSIGKMAEDPELQQIVWQVAREVIIDNPALKGVLLKHWTGPEAKQVLSMALDRVDPTLNEIGHLLFGKRETGFTPEFQRVLKARILRKDRRWFLLELPRQASGAAAPQGPARGGPEVILKVTPGGDAKVDPFLFLAQADHD